MTPFEMTWDAAEFEYREKDVSWYWISIVVAAALIAFAVWERNFLFGFFIVIAEVLAIVWGNEKPRDLTFLLTESEISVGDHRAHALKEFETWSSESQGSGWTELAFNFHGKFRVPLRVLMPSDRLVDVRKNLKPLLREVEHQTSLLDSVEKLLRF